MRIRGPGISRRLERREFRIGQGTGKAAFAKLKAMTEGANLVRAEITG